MNGSPPPLRRLAPAALLLALAACSGGSPNASSVEQDLPPRPSRANFSCCGDATERSMVQLYLALGDALAEDRTDPELVVQIQAALDELLELYHNQEELAAMRAASATLDGDLPSARAAYGDFSDQLYARLADHNDGELDLAVAYGRKSKRQWIQSDDQLRSPYGEPSNEMTWGSREAVQAWDAVTGAAREDRVYDVPPPPGQPPEPPPPDASGQTPPPPEGG